MLTISADFARQINQALAFLDLVVSAFDLAKVNKSRFQSKHGLGKAALDIYAKARAIPTGMSLACEGIFLSVCAQFEQVIRELIEEAAMQVASKKGAFSLLPAKMQEEHTVGCGVILENRYDKFGHLSQSAVAASLHGCLVSPTGTCSLVVEAFSNNERNFKSRIVAEQVGKLGVISLWPSLSQQTCLQAHFGSASADDTRKFACERLDRIMDKRNVIIHRGVGFAAPSDAEVRECANFFIALAEALGRVLANYVSTV